MTTTRQQHTRHPTKDHPRTSTTKIRRRLTPWHLRSFGILVGAGAPPDKINTGPAVPELSTGGASC